MEDSTVEEDSLTTTNWSFNQFLAFLLIYASHVDLDFSKAEKEKIKERVGQAVFDEVYTHFKHRTDYQALQLILNYRNLYFSTEDEKQLLFDEMRLIFHADGEFSTLEKDLLVFLEKLM